MSKDIILLNLKDQDCINIDYFIDRYNKLRKLMTFNYYNNDKEMRRSVFLKALANVTGLDQFIVYAPVDAVYNCVTNYLKRYIKTGHSYYLGRASIYARILVETGAYEIDRFPSVAAYHSKKFGAAIPFFSDTDEFKTLFSEGKDISEFKSVVSIKKKSHRKYKKALPLEQEAILLRKRIEHRYELNRKDEERLSKIQDQIVTRMHFLEKTLQNTKSAIESVLIA